MFSNHAPLIQGRSNYIIQMTLIYLVLVSVFHLTESVENVSPKHSHLWGPGLKSNFVVPARYFFIQAVDLQGNNFTQSVGDKAFEVKFSQANNDFSHRVRVWTQVLDRHDGSYIVRYKVYETYEDLIIQVLHNGQHVGSSPYLMSGMAYHEKCNCPNPSLEAWMHEMSCPNNYRQIKQDLSIFKEVDMKLVREEAVLRFNQRGSHALCHYVVKNNKVYRKTYGEHVGFKMFMDAILLSLTRKVHLPDFELFINLGDWPLEKRSLSEKPLPIFSWCGSDDSRDIIMPTYDVTESTLETMGRVSLDLMSVQANTGPSWSEKNSTAFWRGRDSRRERLDLVKLSQRHPDLIDAKLTNMFFFKHETDLGEVVKHISFFDFFQYKYQINIDGTVAAYRLPYLLAGDSVVLKQESPYYEHFYKQLKPYQHYIPFKRDMSDLLEKLRWAHDHDGQAQKIGKAGQAFVRDNLMPRDIFCYHSILFKEYASRLVRPVEVSEDMELVPQPEDRESLCDCRPHDLPASEREEL